MYPSNYKTRIETANRVLQSFAKTSRIEYRPNGLYVVWQGHNGEMARRWQTNGGQDFYPSWYRKWSGGGTASTALAQLIRWIRGQPVLPLSSWRYWSGEAIALLPRKAVDDLGMGGYPLTAYCVLCGRELVHSFDWWHIKDNYGPCCRWTKGCRQKGASNG